MPEPPPVMRIVLPEVFIAWSPQTNHSGGSIPPAIRQERGEFAQYLICLVKFRSTSECRTSNSSRGLSRIGTLTNSEKTGKTFSHLRDINHTVLPSLATQSGIEFSTSVCARSDESCMGADRSSRRTIQNDEQSLSSCGNQCPAICADISTSICPGAAILRAGIPAEPRRGE
jgi:hypothetical protein